MGNPVALFVGSDIRDGFADVFLNVACDTGRAHFSGAVANPHVNTTTTNAIIPNRLEQLVILTTSHSYVRMERATLCFVADDARYDETLLSIQTKN